MQNIIRRILNVLIVTFWILIMLCIVDIFTSEAFTSSIDITISGDKIELSTKYKSIVPVEYKPIISKDIMNIKPEDMIAKELEEKKNNRVKSSNTKTKSKNTSKYIKDCGVFQLTAYEWTGNPCANGKYPTRNHTVAAHKSDFPLGTVLYIEGYGTFVVEDRGGFPKGTIDIYIGNVKECFQFGRRKARVFVVSYPKKNTKK